MSESSESSILEVIQPNPNMDSEGRECFQQATKLSKCYLEYGSGGSTIYAAKVANIPTIISVESDVNWKRKVEKSVGDSKSQVLLEHCDIGEVGEWGKPKTRDKIGNYWNYMAQPWALARRKNLVPDMILIDGRFRVASFLYSLLAARVGTVILFDDYFDRPMYFVVEEFCPVESRHGRLGRFNVSKGFSATAICERIAKYSIVID